jgi:tetratricopeptide (TPR) repeat protein
MSSKPSSASSPNETDLLSQISLLNRSISASPSANLFIHRGMARFRLAQVPESIEDFNAALKMDTRVLPRLWQRGLSYYYVQKFEEGARQFEVDLEINAHDAGGDNID